MIYLRDTVTRELFCFENPSLAEEFKDNYEFPNRLIKESEGGEL